MQRYQVAIFTLERDIHALAIQKELTAFPNIACRIVETDRVCGGGGLTWASDSFPGIECAVSTTSGKRLELREVDVIWWRRIGVQQVPGYLTDEVQRDIVNNDCRDALLGLAVNEFKGVWVNDPFATQRAENKLIQLKAAGRAGFRVPRTIVSQDPCTIRSFCKMCDNAVVIKTVRGTRMYPLLSVRLTDEMLVRDDVLEMCPAIYQEYVPGVRHIRAQCFGDQIYATAIDSQALDWRANLDVPFEIVKLDGSVEERMRDVLKRLGLRMGVFDFKIGPDGEPVWLEVNPQGQFLFVEGLSGLPLIRAFANFIYELATTV